MSSDRFGGSGSYTGEPIDATVQHISDRPYAGNGTTVEATDDAGADGETTAENVPVPSDGPGEPGQATLDDWGWSA